jgi:hypothetical protein
MPCLAILSDPSVLSRNLDSSLDQVWQTHFADVPRLNTVTIAYSRRPWKGRLGSIHLVESHTLIRINALLRHPEVPVPLLVVTIAHELAHYAHGFGSPLPRLYEHPHANGVVTRELEARGLGETLRESQVWIDREWFALYARQKEAGWPGLAEFSVQQSQRK